LNFYFIEAERGFEWVMLTRAGGPAVDWQIEGLNVRLEVELVDDQEGESHRVSLSVFDFWKNLDHMLGITFRFR
jgi:hypothetical protein